MLDAKAVRMGSLGAVLAVVAWPLLTVAWVAALWAWSKFGPHSGLDFLDTEWTFEGFGRPSLVGLAEAAGLAGFGFVVGIVLARRRKPRTLRQ